MFWNKHTGHDRNIAKYARAIAVDTATAETTEEPETIITPTIPDSTQAEPPKKRIMRGSCVDYKRYLNKSFKDVYEYDTTADKTRLNKLLAPFNLTVSTSHEGMSAITYTVFLDVNTNVNKVMRLSKNIGIALNCNNPRITLDGYKLNIEKPTLQKTVYMGDVYRFNPDSERYADTLTFPLGMGNSDSKPIFYDLRKAPHMLVAGTTGSGKSVFLHSLICYLLMTHMEDIKLIGIDMKGTEFQAYERLKNFSYISDTEEAVEKLEDLCMLMDDRYKEIAAAHCRDIESYNRKALSCSPAEPLEYMEPIVCIIDEFADLMLTSGKEVEKSVVRLAQKARACGIHLVIATQRPTVDVITGLIKANIPTRISFKVNSVVDSRVILDRKGAEQLIGHGDMLFLSNGAYEPIRAQGVFLTENEIDLISCITQMNTPVR